MLLSRMLFVLLFTNFISPQLFGQRPHLFKLIEADDRIYGNWIAPWSMPNYEDKRKRKTYSLPHSVYQFQQNDSLYQIRDEKIVFVRPVRFYERNDTIYISRYNNHVNYIDPSFLRWGKNNLSPVIINQDSFVIRWNNQTTSEVFYRSKSKEIPFENYPAYLAGRMFTEGGFNCTGIYSSAVETSYKFETDATYTKIYTKTFYKGNKVIRIDTTFLGRFPYLIEEDMLILDVGISGGSSPYFTPDTSDPRTTLVRRARPTAYTTRPRRIIQRIGLTENTLLINKMKEVID